MWIARSVPDLTPIPRDAVYLGTLADRVFYDCGGAIWAWTAVAWCGVCLLIDWPQRPEARAIAAQGRSADILRASRLKERTV